MYVKKILIIFFLSVCVFILVYCRESIYETGLQADSETSPSVTEEEIYVPDPGKELRIVNIQKNN